MKNKIKKGLTYFAIYIAILATVSSCTLEHTYYDTPYKHKPKPYLLLKRPDPVKAKYSYGWMRPYGYSSLYKKHEHWPRNRGNRKVRNYWLKNYLPHPAYHSTGWR